MINNYLRVKNLEWFIILVQKKDTKLFNQIDLFGMALFELRSQQINLRHCHGMNAFD